MKYSYLLILFSLLFFEKIDSSAPDQSFITFASNFASLNKDACCNIFQFIDARTLVHSRGVSHQWNQQLTEYLKQENRWTFALPNFFVKKNFIQPSTFTFDKKYPLSPLIRPAQNPLLFAFDYYNKYRPDKNRDKQLFNTLLDQGWDFFWKDAKGQSLIKLAHPSRSQQDF